MILYNIFSSFTQTYRSHLFQGAAKMQGERSTETGVYTEYMRILSIDQRSNAGAQYIFRGAHMFHVKREYQ